MPDNSQMGLLSDSGIGLLNQSDDDVNRLLGILNNYKDLNFVQRILSPYVHPTLQLPEGPGEYGTHLMSWATLGDKNIVYPEIIQTEKGDLTRLDPRAAIDYAVKNKQYIPFNTPEEADWFGKNYKRVWGGEFNK